MFLFQVKLKSRKKKKKKKNSARDFIESRRYSRFYT